MLPDLPKLKDDVQKVIDRYLQFQVNLRLGIFGEAPKHIIQEGNRMRIIRADGSVDESDFKHASAEVSLTLEEIPTLTVQERKAKLDDMAEQMAGQVSRLLFGSLNEALDKAGQVVDQKGKPLDAESVFTVLENMHLEFDDARKLRGLSIVVPSALAPKAEKVMAQIDADPVLRKRHEEIMTRKWMEWRDREASRKLVG
jgi:hypothetical protein